MVIFACINIFVSLEWVFIFCYLGDRATSALLSIPDTIYNMNWHDYSSELRTFIQITMQYSQKPLYFTGFKMIRCSLETFARVSLQCNQFSAIY